MKCSNCNAENSDGAKFCKKCGNPLEEKTINHEEIINSVGNVKTKSDDNTTKIIIIALVIVAIVLAGAFAYIYMSGNSDSGSASNAGSASSDSDKVDSSNQ